MTFDTISTVATYLAYVVVAYAACWPLVALFFVAARALHVLAHPIRARRVVLGRLLAVVVLLACARSASADCGEERAAVKLGKDADARKVPLLPVDATIAELVLRPAPRHPPSSRRARDERDTEFKVWRISGMVTGYKLEADGDYHVVLADEHGQTMIVEIPDPGCAATGAWAQQILSARAAFRRTLADNFLPSPGKKLHAASLRVTVTGVGFFDKVHGQSGVARNGVELHPVLDISAQSIGGVR